MNVIDKIENSFKALHLGNLNKLCLQTELFLIDIIDEESADTESS